MSDNDNIVVTCKVTVTHGNKSSVRIRSDCINVSIAPSIEVHSSWSQCTMIVAGILRNGTAKQLSVSILKQVSDVVMQDRLLLTPYGSNRLGCSWLKLWRGLTLTPMWQKTGAWLRGSNTGGPPYCWHYSHRPKMTTSLSWWWHASIWSQQPPTWPQTHTATAFLVFVVLKGKTKATCEYHMKTIWVNKSSCAVVVKKRIQYQL